MEGRKNTEQEKDKGSGEIFDKVEGIYVRRRYLGKERELEECRRVD